MVALRLKVVQDIKMALENFSAVSYPVGEPPIKLMDKLILGDSSFFSRIQFVEDELLQVIYHHKDTVWVSGYLTSLIIFILYTKIK